MNLSRVEKGFLRGALILCSLVGLLLASCRQAAPAPIQIIPPAPTPTPMPTMTPAPIMVYVSGEVIRPDVYELAPNSRIKQLVEAAGGFAADADPAAVNLAQPLTDGSHVHVPAKGEPSSTPPPVVSTPLAQRNSGVIDLGLGGQLVNINTADLAELETLPGIGPITAQKILDYRSVNGPYPNIEAIMEVSGIGPVTFEKIKPLITTTD